MNNLFERIECLGVSDGQSKRTWLVSQHLPKRSMIRELKGEINEKEKMDRVFDVGTSNCCLCLLIR